MDERELRRKTMKLSLKEAAAYSVSVGAGTNYITPYALAFNASNSQIALLASLPNLLSSLFQMFTPKLMEVFRRKDITVSAIFTQALLWIPIILLIPFYRIYPKITPYMLIILVTFYSTLNAFISPIWRSWISDIVPEKRRGDFFGTRNRFAIFAEVSSMLLAAFLLDKTKVIGKVFFGFALIFSAAMIGRFLSGYFLLKHYEPKFKPEKGKYFSFLQFIKKAPKNNFGRFAIYWALLTAAIYIAAPFFSVYILKDLKFSYISYTLLIVSSSVGMIFGMYFWGKISDYVGNKKVLSITGFTLPLVPILWILSANLIYLIIVRLVSGFFWAGFSLSSYNFIFDAATRARRGLCVAYTNVMNGVGMFIGSALGGLISTHFPFSFMGAIPFIFVLSALARFVVSFTMLRKINEVRTSVKELGILYLIRHNLVEFGRH